MTTTQQHLLNLKVLRLSQPSLQQKHEVDVLLEKDVQQTSDFLTLPGSFGNIYLGETFTSYLCVNNESNTSVSNVAFKAELQTATQRFTLADTIGTASPAGSTFNVARPANDVSLLPRQSSEFIIQHEIKELGIHILVCSVHYSPGSSKDPQRKFFRKFFKFQVLNPLTVKTKANSLADGTIQLEIQLQNLANLPLYLNNLEYLVADCFNVVDLNMGSVFSNKVLAPQDTRQYLYVLSPKADAEKTARTTPNLGRLDINWTTTLGQKGHLQTSQLARKLPILDPLKVFIVDIPNVIKVQEAFKVLLRVCNNSSEIVSLSLEGNRTKMSGIYLQGQNTYDLGTIPPLAYSDLEIDLISLITGIVNIEGLVLKNTVNGSIFSISGLKKLQVVL